jgi:hypothetical protein
MQLLAPSGQARLVVPGALLYPHLLTMYSLQTYPQALALLLLATQALNQLTVLGLLEH